MAQKLEALVEELRRELNATTAALRTLSGVEHESRLTFRQMLFRLDADLAQLQPLLNASHQNRILDLQAEIRQFLQIAEEAERYADERARNTTAELNRLRAIEGSTLWRSVAPLRTLFARQPWLRRWTRRAAKLIWWTASGQVLAKLRARREMAAQGTIAATSEAPSLAPPAHPEVPPVLRRRPRRGQLRVVFLSGEPETPGHLYRVERYAAAARLAGASVTVLRLQNAPQDLTSLSDADLLWIWRAAWNEFVEAMITTARAGGAEIMFDVDDYMIDPDLARVEIVDGIRSQSFDVEAVRALWARMQTTFAHATFASAPTAFLAARLRLYLKPSFVLPNAFDEDTFHTSRRAARQRKARAPDGWIRVGYATGSRTHQKDFAVAADAVAQVLRERPQTRLVLFQHFGSPVLDLSEFPAFAGLESRVEWRELVPIRQLPTVLADFDVNLAPLEVGNPFCEAKSELKYFEAALVDVPTVASPTEPFRTAIRHAETGLLASTAQEWHAALLRLVDDPGYRAGLARAAHFDVIARYGSERCAEFVASVLEHICQPGRRAARAFQLDLARQASASPRLPTVPPHEVLFQHESEATSEVTVVIPLYNYAHYVEEALESVLRQTLPALDLIVVDDRSTDDSATVARQWLEQNAGRFGLVQLIRNVRNAGLGLTRNVGFACAETAFVLPLDADNALDPACAERCLTTMKETGAAFVYPVIQLFGEETGQIGTYPYDPVRLVSGNYIDAMALIRRSAWADVGGYDHVRFGWEDFDLWCKLVERGHFGQQLNEAVARYRVHGSSMLRRETDVRQNKIDLIEDISRRHRWLRIERPPEMGSGTIAHSRVAAPTVAPEPPAQRVRLDRLLPILRCPETGERLVHSGDRLTTASSQRAWPILAGRPVLFPGMTAPKVMPLEHLSNEVPERALDLIRNTEGLVLNLSAGGTQRRFEHVIEAEAAIFRHTDVVADSHALPFEDDTFELVIAMNAFEHYHSPERVVGEIKRVLKPGGQVLIRTAFLQPLHEPPWHFYNCTRYGLERWFAPFQTIDLQVSDNFNPAYAVSWIASEAEAALRRDVSAAAAELFRQAPCSRLVDLWRDPCHRGEELWTNFFALKQASQEALAAGFEFLGRKPPAAGRSLPGAETEVRQNNRGLIEDVSGLPSSGRPQYPDEACKSQVADRRGDIAPSPLAREFSAQRVRLDRLLPILRCPETGERLVHSGDRLTTASSQRAWPILAGRPVLFPGMTAPKVMPLEHLSNEVPERALDLIRNTEGLVLNLSAGGTQRRFEHVIEAEAAIFRHTDVVADSHALPFEDDTFELVIAMNAFEHYHSPERVVGEIKRVLKPGGQVLIRTAFLQPLHEPPWHFYNCTRYGLERWFAPFQTIDLQVSDNFNPAYAVSWIASEAEAALRRDVSAAAAELFRQAPCSRLVDLWRDPCHRGEELWTNFFALKQASQEALAAGFEFLGRKPPVSEGASHTGSE